MSLVLETTVKEKMKVRDSDGFTVTSIVQLSFSEHFLIGPFSGVKHIEEGNECKNNKDLKEDENIFKTNEEHDLRDKEDEEGDRIFVKNPYECNKCGFRANNRYYMKKHIQCVHINENPAMCEFCSTRYKDLNALKNHMEALHESSIQAAREHCGKLFRTTEKTFSNIPSLTKHQNGHTRVVDYVCDICSKTFFNRKALYIHRRFHSSYTSLSVPSM